MEQISVKLTKSPLDISDAFEFISSVNCGANFIFIGTTRINEHHNDLGKVQSLFYEAYEEMAVNLIKEIALDCLRANTLNGSLHRIYIAHRLGEVRLGKSSIVIGVSSPNRSSSHQMVMDILNKIKQKVPIWKKICYENPTSGQMSERWSENSEAFWLNPKP